MQVIFDKEFKVVNGNKLTKAIVITGFSIRFVNGKTIHSDDERLNPPDNIPISEITLITETNDEYLLDNKAFIKYHLKNNIMGVYANEHHYHYLHSQAFTLNCGLILNRALKCFILRLNDQYTVNAMHLYTVDIKGIFDGLYSYYTMATPKRNIHIDPDSIIHTTEQGVTSIETNQGTLVINKSLQGTTIHLDGKEIYPDGVNLVSSYNILYFLECIL